MVYIDDSEFRTLEPVNPKLMQKKKDGTWRWDNKQTILPNELVYVKLFNPDGERGLGPVDVVKQEISNDLQASDYSTKFFENFAQLGGTLRDENGRITAPEMTKLVSDFNAAHSGANNSHKVLGLPKGVQYDEAKQTMKEMEFLDSRKDIRDRILATLGIHKALFGVTDQVNRSVAEEATRQLWMQTLKPKAIAIQQKFNQQFFRKYYPGYRIEFDFTGIDALKESMLGLLDQAIKLRNLGYTINEVNTHLNLGMEDVDDTLGDLRLIPSNLIPVDDMILDDSDTKSVDTKDIDTTIDKIDKILNNTETKNADQYKRKYNLVQRKSEKTFAAKLKGYFAKELGLILGIVNTSTKATKDINTLLSEIQNLLNTEEKERLYKLLLPLYEGTSLDGDKLALTTLELDKVPVVNTVLAIDMANKIKDINVYTYKLLRGQIKEGIDAGETITQIEKRVIKVYKFNSSRARTIARTESSNTVNRTTAARYEKQGVKKKRWLSSGDASVRPAHGSNAAKGVQDWDYVYSGGLKFPGDPVGGASQVVNCRCTLMAVVDK